MKKPEHMKWRKENRPLSKSERFFAKRLADEKPTPEWPFYKPDERAA